MRCCFSRYFIFIKRHRIVSVAFFVFISASLISSNSLPTKSYTIIQ